MSVYEQIKADLGYLKLDAAAGSFAMLAEQAKAEDWTHIEYLARPIAEQATADRNRRLAARLRYARFPFQRTIEDFDYEFQPSVDRKLVEAKVEPEQSSHQDVTSLEIPQSIRVVLWDSVQLMTRLTYRQRASSSWQLTD